MFWETEIQDNAVSNFDIDCTYNNAIILKFYQEINKIILKTIIYKPKYPKS